MKSARLLCLLAFVLVPGLLRAALSPVPVVEITKVNLPKVEIRITSPSKTEPCIIWEPGMSWEEQNKWFSLRTAAGGRVWELHPERRDYTRNFPDPQTIPAGKSVECQYDFSDKSWRLPKGFAAGEWKYEIQAHLQIPRGTDAHREGVFIGHVTSAWHNSAGREVEKAGPPQRDEVYAAIETRKDFPKRQLIVQLERWMTGTLPNNQTVGGFLGADFPWGALEGFCSGEEAIVILLPDRQLLTFVFYVDISKNFKPTDHWLPAKDMLAKIPAQRLSHIAASDRDPDLRFSRFFDEKGRIDQKKTRASGDN